MLEELKATNCPATTEIKFDVGEFSLIGKPFLKGKINEAYAPRRRYLDKILVDAAVRAGAELREGFTVTELVKDGNRVTGIRGRDKNGGIVTEKAKIVVGADGVRSFVAKNVDAPVYLDRGMLTCNYYSYWSGIDIDRVELYPREETMTVVDATNDGLTMVVMVWKAEMFNRVRANVEGEFMAALDEQIPELAEKVRGGTTRRAFCRNGTYSEFFPKGLRKRLGFGRRCGLSQRPYDGTGNHKQFQPRRNACKCIGRRFFRSSPDK